VTNPILPAINCNKVLKWLIVRSFTTTTKQARNSISHICVMEADNLRIEMQKSSQITTSLLLCCRLLLVRNSASSADLMSERMMMNRFPFDSESI